MSDYEFKSTIMQIRAVEDCIRATKKYTEGIETVRKHHPIQGDGFPSRMFCKFYEVYPEMDITWEMKADKAIDWLWGDTKHINLVFKYDYRVNQASLTVIHGNGALLELKKSIPGFDKTLVGLESNVR
jgi:hypothetical protein